MGKNEVELNHNNNTTAVKIINIIKYRKSQSNKDSHNRKTQTSKSLHSCKKIIIPSNDYSEEPNHKTNTNDNIINSDRMSQLRRSYRLKNLKKGNESIQQTKKKKYKRDSIQSTTKEKRVRNRKENIITQQNHIVKRIGKVRIGKTTNNVGSNIICFVIIM